MLSGLIASGLSIWLQNRPMTDFRFVLSGPLVEEIPHDTVAMIWKVSSNPVPPVSVPVSRFPVRIPFDQLANSTWNVSFVDPDAKDTPLFTVELSRDLFDQPRKINILLRKPAPQLRPFMDDWKRIRYTANISNRMHYRDLPFWDENGELTAGPRQPPIITVSQYPEGKILFKDEMTIGCWGSRWFSRMDDKFRVNSDTQLHFAVTYSSGGSFGDIETKFEFSHDASRHH